jgi:hypothetical protein
MELRAASLLRVVKEPKAVSEARAALKRFYWRISGPIAWATLGWVFMFPAETLAGDLGIWVALGAYLATTVAAMVFLGVEATKNKWAEDLLKAWARAKADASVRDALLEAGLAPPAQDAVPSAVLIGRIREHLEVDARALHAAEAAYERLKRLRTEGEAAADALDGLPNGPGKNKLAAAVQRLHAEVHEIEGSLAALYATLISRDATPSFGGLKDTMLELEAEAEVAKSLLDRLPKEEPSTGLADEPSAQANRALRGEGQVG